jgi:hypothetical protein
MDPRIKKLLKAWVEAYVSSARADDHRRLVGEIGEKRLELLDAQVRVVMMILAYRSLDRAVDESELGWTERFLELQQYGSSPEEKGATFEVYLLGVMNAPIVVDELSDIDFADLTGGTDCSRILLRCITGEFSEERARTIALDIHQDLNFDEGIDTFWGFSDDMLLVGIDGLTDDPDDMGQQRFLGSLIVE